MFVLLASFFHVWITRNRLLSMDTLWHQLPICNALSLTKVQKLLNSPVNGNLAMTVNSSYQKSWPSANAHSVRNKYIGPENYPPLSGGPRWIVYLFHISLTIARGNFWFSSVSFPWQSLLSLSQAVHFTYILYSLGHTVFMILKSSLPWRNGVSRFSHEFKNAGICMEMRGRSNFTWRFYEGEGGWSPALRDKS